MASDILISSGSVTAETTFAGIYRWHNHVTGKDYIGQSLDVLDRVEAYPQIAKGQPRIYNSMMQHGMSEFSCYKVMDCCPSKIALNYWETFWIKELNTLHPNGYNLRSGGGQGNRLNEESRLKMSNSLKGRVSPNKGKKMSPDQRRRLSSLRVGILHTEETKKKMSESHVGKKMGPMSDATKEKLRNVNLGKKHSPETIAKMRATRNSPEYKSKVVGKKRPPPSKEYKLQLSSRMKEWWKQRKDNSI